MVVQNRGLGNSKPTSVLLVSLMQGSHHIMSCLEAETIVLHSTTTPKRSTQPSSPISQIIRTLDTWSLDSKPEKEGLHIYKRTSSLASQFTSPPSVDCLGLHVRTSSTEKETVLRPVIIARKKDIFWNSETSQSPVRETISMRYGAWPKRAAYDPSHAWPNPLELYEWHTSSSPTMKSVEILNRRSDGTGVQREPGSPITRGNMLYSPINQRAFIQRMTRAAGGMDMTPMK